MKYCLGDGCRFQLRVLGAATAKVGATVVSLFPAKTWMGRANGLRADVASLLNESQPAFLRTPGGCYVEGHNLSASGWAWKKTLGPIEGRAGHMNDVWGYWLGSRFCTKNMISEGTSRASLPYLAAHTS